MSQNEREEALRLAEEAGIGEGFRTITGMDKKLANLIRLARQSAPQGEPVAFRWSEDGGKHWFAWTSEFGYETKAKKLGCLIEYAYASPPAQPDVVPEGFVLVPKEPTPAMFDEMHSHRDGKYDSMNFYRALLAAAPKPEVKDDNG